MPYPSAYVRNAADGIPLETPTVTLVDENPVQFVAEIYNPGPDAQAVDVNFDTSFDPSLGPPSAAAAASWTYSGPNGSVLVPAGGTSAPMVWTFTIYEPGATLIGDGAVQVCTPYTGGGSGSRLTPRHGDFVNTARINVAGGLYRTPSATRCYVEVEPALNVTVGVGSTTSTSSIKITNPTALARSVTLVANHQGSSLPAAGPVSINWSTPSTTVAVPAATTITVNYTLTGIRPCDHTVLHVGAQDLTYKSFRPTLLTVTPASQITTTGYWSIDGGATEASEPIAAVNVQAPNDPDWYLPTSPWQNLITWFGEVIIPFEVDFIDLCFGEETGGPTAFASDDSRLSSPLHDVGFGGGWRVVLNGATPLFGGYPVSGDQQQGTRYARIPRAAWASGSFTGTESFTYQLSRYNGDGYKHGFNVGSGGRLTTTVGVIPVGQQTHRMYFVGAVAEDRKYVIIDPPVVDVLSRWRIGRIGIGNGA